MLYYSTHIACTTTWYRKVVQTQRLSGWLCFGLLDNKSPLRPGRGFFVQHFPSPGHVLGRPIFKTSMLALRLCFSGVTKVKYTHTGLSSLPKGVKMSQR